jgi:hypothetical protein
VNVGALERIARTFNRRRDGLRCHSCNSPLRREHRHVLELRDHQLLCVCQGCALRVAQRREGAYRVVPQMVRDGSNAVSRGAAWQALGIPSRLAFFVRVSLLQRWMAVIPSRAGAQAHALPEAEWTTFIRTSSWGARLVPDVEALVVRDVGDGVLESYVVPLTFCYDLVAIVRQNWQGADGGSALCRELEAFFGKLRSACQESEALDASAE